MKKKQIIASLREELDAMRRIAESAEKKLYGEPVWVDADDEEIDFECGMYCLASEMKDKDSFGRDVSFAAGTPVRLCRPSIVILCSGHETSRICCVRGSFGDCGSIDPETLIPPGGLVEYSVRFKGDENWHGKRLIVPVRKVKDETAKED